MIELLLHRLSRCSVVVSCCYIVYLECDTGFYGEDCKFRCGKCEGGPQCDKETGACPHGCELGWVEPRCSQGKDHRHTNAEKILFKSLKSREGHIRSVI